MRAELDRTRSGGIRANVMAGLLGELLRFVLESLMLCALLVLGIFQLRSARDPQRIVGLLGLQGMAGSELMPAAEAIIKAAAQIRTNASVFNSIAGAIVEGRGVVARTDADGDLLKPANHPDMFDHVSYRYPKSIVADLLLGLLNPRLGRITVGHVPIDIMPERWRKGLRYVARNIFLLDSSIAQSPLLSRSVRRRRSGGHGRSSG